MVLILVAVVATVLPAVAVADVLVVGYAGGTGMQIGPAFYIQHGENYMAANQTVGFGWHQNKANSQEVLGNMVFGYSTNETISEINVLDINFTNANYGNFTIILNVNDPSPTGSIIYFSNASFAFNGTEIAADPPGGPLIGPAPPPPPPTSPTPGQTPPPPMPAGKTSTPIVNLQDAYLNATGTYTFTFDHVHKGSTIYVAFVIGSGSMTTQPAFELTMSEMF
ncbi:MAG: hypothetical protein ACP5UV_04095 [Thermoplasmata archaeon]